jgi:hypothetical protein
MTLWYYSTIPCCLINQFKSLSLHPFIASLFDIIKRVYHYEYVHSSLTSSSPYNIYALEARFYLIFPTAVHPPVPTRSYIHQVKGSTSQSTSNSWSFLTSARIYRLVEFVHHAVLDVLVENVHLGVRKLPR